MLPACVQSYEYSVRDYRTVAGDIIETLIDLGFNTYHRTHCYLHGVDAPGVHCAAGEAVRKVTHAWLAKRSHTGIVVNSMSLHPKGSEYYEYYGRIRTASLYRDDKTRCLNDYLLAHNLVRPYTDRNLSWDPDALKAIEATATSILKGEGIYPPIRRDAAV